MSTDTSRIEQLEAKVAELLELERLLQERINVLSDRIDNAVEWLKMLSRPEEVTP